MTTQNCHLCIMINLSVTPFETYHSEPQSSGVLTLFKTLTDSLEPLASGYSPLCEPALAPGENVGKLAFDPGPLPVSVSLLRNSNLDMVTLFSTVLLL